MPLKENLNPDDIALMWWREDYTWTINGRHYYLIQAYFDGYEDVFPHIGTYAVNAYTGALYEKKDLFGYTELVPVV